MKAKRIFSQTFGVVAAVIESGGKILLVKEGNQKKYDYGKWQLPTGWLEVGESPIDGARREAKEETGYEFTPKHFLGVYSLVREDVRAHHQGLTPHPIKLVFIGTINTVQRSKLADDIAENGWFSQDQIMAMKQSELRDMDVKSIINDYFTGKRYPLDIVSHTIQSQFAE